MKAMLRYAGVTVLVATVVALTGCAAIAQKAVESATGVKVDPTSNTISVTGQDGKQVTLSSSAKLPDGFPDDVPIYDPSTVTNSLTIPSDKGASYSVELKTDASVADVSAWYAGKLKSEGWTNKASMNSADGGGLISSEKGTNVLQVVFSSGSGSDAKTTIAMTYAPK